MSTHLRSWIVLLAFGACICSASARVFGGAQAPARQPAVTTGVVYGHKDESSRKVLHLDGTTRRELEREAASWTRVAAAINRILG